MSYPCLAGSALSTQFCLCFVILFDVLPTTGLKESPSLWITCQRSAPQSQTAQALLQRYCITSKTSRLALCHRNLNFYNSAIYSRRRTYIFFVKYLLDVTLLLYCVQSMILLCPSVCVCVCMCVCSGKVIVQYCAACPL